MWAALLTFGESPWTTGAGVLIGADLILFTAIAAVAVLLSPGRWLKVLSVAIGVVIGLLAVTLEVGALWLVGLLASAAATALLWARPMEEWMVGAVRPDRVPPKATVLVLVTLAIPAAVGATAFSDVTPGGWTLAGLAVPLGWAYARAIPAALWALRLGLPGLAVWAIVGLAPTAAVALGGYLSGVVALSWTEDARVAASPLVPRKVDSASVLPEMVPTELMESAGLDRLGQPRESS